MIGVDRTQKSVRAWPLIAQREIQVKLADRNFLISTVLTLFLVLGLMGLQGWLSGSAETYEVAVADQEAGTVVAQAEQVLQEVEEDAAIAPLTRADQAAAEQAVRDDDAAAALVRTEDGWTLISDGTPDSELRQAVAAAVSSHVLEQRATAAGTSADALLAGADLATEDISTKAPGSESVYFVVGLFFAFLFYMASIMFGMSIASSVVEEKQSRVVEIIAAAVPTSQLLVGKVVGTMTLALGQLVLIVGVGLLGSTFTDYDVLLPGIGPALAWYLPFFLLGFLALACVWAAAGAVASRSEDLQSTASPLTLGLIVAFVVGVSLEGTAQQVASFVPVVSTILMPMRLLDGQAAAWEPALALALTLCFTAVTIWLGSRLYQRSVLHTQGMLGWRRAWGAPTERAAD